MIGATQLGVFYHGAIIQVRYVYYLNGSAVEFLLCEFVEPEKLQGATVLELKRVLAVGRFQLRVMKHQDDLAAYREWCKEMDGE